MDFLEIFDTKLKKRMLYNGNQYTLDYDNKELILNKTFHELLLKNRGKWNGFKKIYATNLGDILNVDGFSSPFAAFCKLFNLTLPMLDDKYVYAGKVLEPKVLDAVESKMKSPVDRLNDVSEYDYFKNNLQFGGIPDGYLHEKKWIIEVKTTNIKNYELWKNTTPPIKYIKQAQLYAYLINANKFSIVALFLNDEDYVHPELLDLKKRHLKNFDYSLNLMQVKDDVDTAINWYEKYTKLGISPKWKDNVDSEFLEYLACHNEQEWKDLFLKWANEGKVSFHE